MLPNPDVLARTGSFITCPLIEHRNSDGIDESIATLLLVVVMLFIIPCRGLFLPSVGSSRLRATLTSRLRCSLSSYLALSDGKSPSHNYNISNQYIR